MIDLRGKARVAYHTLRRAGNRAAHPFRRRRALRSLAALSPRSVLVVCHGNVCRSPYLAAILRRDMGASVVVESAGFVGPGREVPAHAALVAGRRGIDLSAHRSQTISPKLLGADLIIVMDPRQRSAIDHLVVRARGSIVLLGDLDPERATERTVLDPWNKGEDAFEASYARIDRCARVLVEALSRG